MVRQRFALAHTAYLLAVTVAGVGLVTWLTIRPGFLSRSWTFDEELGWVFLLAIASRFLSFEIFERERIALDSVLYVAAAFMFGVVPATWLVLVTLMGSGIVAMLAGPHGASALLSRRLLQIAFNAALPAVALILVGEMFRVDARREYSDLQLISTLPAVAVCFLVIHYALAAVAHWLSGGRVFELLRYFFLRVFGAELVLMPLSLAMVMGYEHQGLVLFLLLGITSVISSAVFRRAVTATQKLKRRVEELTTLNKVGRIISSSLERETLMANIASETLQLVKHTSRFMIGVIDEPTGTVTYELFNEQGKNYKQLHAPREDGLSGWVMAHRQPLLLGDVQRQYVLYSRTNTYNDPNFNSWLGVPLVIYDAVMGVIAVQSEHVHAYNLHDLRFLSTIADQAAVALENARLYELATIDGLSGLFVRRYFDQRLLEEWQRSQRHLEPFTLGLLDLDLFKKLNDTYGHQAGDQVLRSAAVALRSNMRTVDLPARYGGEEFAFILPRTSVEEAVRVAERIRIDIEKMVTPYGGVNLQITASIGLAGYPDADVLDIAELVARADQALYQAKRDGRNRVVVSTSTSSEGLQEAIGYQVDDGHYNQAY